MRRTVRLHYDEIGGIIHKFRDEGEDIVQLHATLRDRVRDLHKDWEGEAAEKFFGEMEHEVLPAITRLSRALFFSQDVLRKLSKLIQDYDKETAGFFTGDFVQASAIHPGVLGVAAGIGAAAGGGVAIPYPNFDQGTPGGQSQGSAAGVGSQAAGAAAGQGAAAGIGAQQATGSGAGGGGGGSGGSSQGLQGGLGSMGGGVGAQVGGAGGGGAGGSAGGGGSQAPDHVYGGTGGGSGVGGSAAQTAQGAGGGGGAAAAGAGGEGAAAAGAAGVAGTAAAGGAAKAVKGKSTKNKK